MGRIILNNALRSIVNAERRGKSVVELQPISSLIASFLKVMRAHGYIKDFQVHDPHRVGRISVHLLGRIQDARALTYGCDIKAKDIKEYTARSLPTRQWGHVVITTSDGVLDHEEAIKRKAGETKGSEAAQSDAITAVARPKLQMSYDEQTQTQTEN